MATKPNITLPNGQVISGSDPNYAEYARQQGVNTPTPVQPPVQPTQPPIQSQQPQAPQGSVAIDGAKFNTKETQQANFTNIQPIGNTLYGIPKAPVVPDIIPQKDLGNALSSETSAKVGAEAQGLVGFNEQQIADLNKANLRVIQGTATETDLKNLDYAKSKGWQPTETKEEILQPSSATVIGEPDPMKSTTDQIFEKMWNMGALRQQAKAEAMKDQNLMAKGEAIATAETFLNKLRTELQNKEIFDIKEQDVIRAKPILTSQIAGQLNELSREQKLDAMILQNNYNNALVEYQIAQGNYDRAREIVKETADDVYEASMFQIEALQFKNQIENIEADRLRENLEYERSLSLEGYTHIKSPEALKGLTESEIFRDPVSGKIYMKPEPKVEQIIEVGGRKIGLDKNGNKIRDYGSTLTPDQMLELENAGWTFDNAGNPITPSQSDSGIFFTDANGDSWNIAGWATDQTKPQQMDRIAKQIGKVTEENIDEKVKEFTPGLTADMIKEASAQSGVSWEAIMTMVVQEAQGGLSNVAKNNNNFGGLTFNNQEWIKAFGGDKGTSRPSAEGGNYIKFPTKQQGLNAMAALMASYGKVDTNKNESKFSQVAIDWAESIRDGKAKLTDITRDVEKSNPGLKSEVVSIMKTLPPSEAQIKEAQSFVDKLKELRDHKGLNSSVGPIGIARTGIFGDFWTGAKDAFLGKADTLISKKALNSLIESKSQGATFGALSDTEMAILKAAGTSLGAWSTSKKDGKLKHFDVDEKTFKNELNNMISDYESLLSKANISQSLDSYLSNNPSKVNEYNAILTNNPNLTEEEILQIIQ